MDDAGSSIGANNKEDEDKKLSLPQKKYYRQRAHSNPISDHLVD